MIILVAGARPNFMKIAPIVRQLRQRADRYDFRIVHTGQHYDAGMSGVFFTELEIPLPDFQLDVGGGTHAEQTAAIMTRFETVCQQVSPDLVMVVGDVNSTLACALVTKKLNIALAHVEAGLRSGDRTMPEEINRLVTDAVSDYFFVTEQSAISHLQKEGQDLERIFFVGQVMIDNLLHQVNRIDRGDYTELLARPAPADLQHYAVVTLHRTANVDNQANLAWLAGMLAEVAEKIPLVFPLHPRTRANLQRFGLQLSPAIIQLEPLSYVRFLDCFRRARFVMTDSGGLQEETTALGIPCITLRGSTERPVTVNEGTNTVLLDKQQIKTTVDEILAGGGKRGRIPDFWDGKAAERILDVLDTQL